MDQNKNKMTFNFITGEDFEKKKGAMPPGKSNLSSGVDDMFKALREAKDTEGADKAGERNQGDLRERGEKQVTVGVFVDADSFKRGLVNARKKLMTSEKTSNFEVIAKKV